MTRRTVGHRQREPGPRGRARASILALAILLAASLAGSPSHAADTSPAEDIDSLSDLADKGRAAEVEIRGRALLVRAEAESGPESLAVAEVLTAFVHALVVIGKGAAPDTLAMALRALAIKTSGLGESSPGIADALAALGGVYLAMGDYPSARSHLERALALRERTPVPEDEATVRIFSTMGTILAEAGDYIGARDYYEKCLAALDRSKRSRPYMMARATSNYGTVLHGLGDLGSARAVYERGLDRTRAEIGEDHPAYAQLLDNLGVVLDDSGDVEGARAAFESALAIREKTLGPERPAVAVSLTNLAFVHLDSGEAATARPLFERALRIRETAFGPMHPLTAITLTGLGRTLVDLGETGAARPLLERALRIRQERLGTEHPFYARSLIHIANLDYRTGNPENALQVALRAEEILRGQIVRTARFLSDRQALEYRSIERSGLDVALAVGADDARSRRDAPRVLRSWEALIRSRALILDEVTARHRSLLDSAPPELAPSLREWEAARARFATLVVRGPNPSLPGDYRDHLSRAREEVDRAERDVAVRSAAQLRASAARTANIEDLKRALPADASLVAYVRFDKPRKRGGVETVYAAFVIPSGRGNPALVSLGRSEAIDNLVQRFRIETGAPPRSESSLATCREIGSELRRLVWDPVRRLIGNARIVFLVPDADLHLLNFATLPVGQDGYLLETGPTLHYLSAERDILMLSARDQDRTETSPTGGLLALGGLDFGDRPPEAPARDRPGPETAVPRAAPRAPICEGLGNLTFRPLPGSLVEVEEIASLWTRSNGGMPSATPLPGGALVLTGRQGQEVEFKQRAPGRRIIHLATHGLSLDGVCHSARTGEGDRAAGRHEASERTFPVFGLALAGANRRPRAAGRADVEDGILTADEIAALNLRGTEWAVLSGCQTGVGPALRGEGVLGLRRSFQIAGARTLVMSLWPVGDQDALEWILELYRARLAGRTTAEAVRDAGLRVLDNRRRSGVMSHPHFWGAFVAAGDWK